jgi:predicted AAA+ superfamily ATPase
MIPRLAAVALRRLLAGFPVVTVTGPRQSGKTTLVRAVIGSKPYISLETPAEREFAQSAPHDFLRRFPDGAVIDEAQRAPALLSELQGVLDSDGRMGLFVLTGSHNLSLLAGVSQSLAGRNGILELLPLSLAELRPEKLVPPSIDEILLKGFYPALYARPVDPYDWLQSYIVTYAERDARQLRAIEDLNAFQRFLRLTAARTGQLLNMASLASDCGVAERTARNWLSVLETCYLIHYVRPHLSNFGKRLVKMPKLYFLDAALAAALLGIQTPQQISAHPLKGALFETMVVNEFLKARRNAGRRDQLYFWRDNIGTEVDLVLEQGQELAGIEIKAGSRVASDATASLRKWQKYAAGVKTHLGVVYGGEEVYEREGVSMLPWGLL